MARPRLPTKVLELKGAFLKDPQRKKAREHEPEPVSPLGPAPDHLNEAKRARWNEAAHECPWLAGSDRPLMEVFCGLWQAQRDNTITSPDKKLLVQICRALGMAPGERSRMVIRGTTPKSKISRFA